MIRKGNNFGKAYLQAISSNLYNFLHCQRAGFAFLSEEWNKIRETPTKLLDGVYEILLSIWITFSDFVLVVLA